MAITRVAVPKAMGLKQVLGFAKPVIDTPLPSSAVVDMVSVAEGTAGTGAPPPLVGTPAAAGGAS